MTRSICQGPSFTSGSARERSRSRLRLESRLHGRYEDEHAADGDDGRLVAMSPQDRSWTSWERHPAGEEVVVLLSGRVDLVQDTDGEENVVELRPGFAAINPAGVWHRSVVHEPGQALFITPGRGTEHRPLA